jgi:hypothetical protein
MEDEVHVAGLTILGDNLHVILDVLEEEELLQEECSAAVSNVQYRPKLFTHLPRLYLGQTADRYCVLTSA